MQKSETRLYRISIDEDERTVAGPIHHDLDRAATLGSPARRATVAATASHGRVGGGQTCGGAASVPRHGIVEPPAAAAGRNELDLEARQAAAQSALAAPERVVSVKLAARSTA